MTTHSYISHFCNKLFVSEKMTTEPLSEVYVKEESDDVTAFTTDSDDVTMIKEETDDRLFIKKEGTFRIY